jgi:drug/metabolite transporter (DMT)-like permease
MNETLRWWLILQVIGVVSLPLFLAFFRRLPDRGYALSKPFGLLLLGYTFWLLNSMRALPNSVAGIVFTMVLLAALSAAFVFREREGMARWLNDHWQYIVGRGAVLRRLRHRRVPAVAGRP